MINTVGIIGLGAVGAMYAELLRGQYEKEQVICLADEERVKRYQRDGVYTNGKLLDITYKSFQEAEPVDLLIFATKYYSLEEAAAGASGAVGPDTIVMSFLNGIISEELVERVLHPAHLLYTTVQGMDAGKVGNQITFQHIGSVSFAEKDGSVSRDVKEAAEVMEKIGMPYSNPEDMMRQLYSKWMTNVGVNQTCAYYACSYKGVQPGGPYRDTYIAAMEEAKTLANAEGVNLKEEDIRYWLSVIDSLAPDGEPSMRQDTKAGRQTEAELFCGTAVRLARRHGIPVPVNQMFYERFLA